MATDSTGSDREATRSAIARTCDRLAPLRRSEVALDLVTIAKRLGARDVRYEATRAHGYSDWTSRGAVVRIAMSKTDGRRRATLAHECAHLLLNPIFAPDNHTTLLPEFAQMARSIVGRDIEGLRGAVEQDGIERVCDAIAFELLLPQSRIEEVKSEVSGIDDLRRVASKYRISLSLLANQLNSHGDRLILLRMTKGFDGTWIVVDAAGRATQWSPGDGLDDESARRLGVLVPDIQHQNVPLRREGAKSSASMSVRRTRTSALAMARLS